MVQLKIGLNTWEALGQDIISKGEQDGSVHKPALLLIVGIINMNKTIRKLLCLLGFHKYKEFLFSRDPKIWERRCIYCGYSPTWER